MCNNIKRRTVFKIQILNLLMEFGLVLIVVQFTDLKLFTVGFPIINVMLFHVKQFIVELIIFYVN